MTKEVGVGMMQPQIKGGWQPPEAGRGQTSLEPPEGTSSPTP